MKTACICAIGSAAEQRRVCVIRCAAWLSRHGGVRNGRFGNRARQVFSLMSVSSDVKRITYLQTHIHFVSFHTTNMISDNKHSRFSKRRKCRLTATFSWFNSLFWSTLTLTIYTWYVQIIRLPSATVSPRSYESSVWFKWFKRGIPFRKRFPNEQAAISIVDPLPKEEKKNEWKKERGIEQLSAHFALRSIVLVIPRW